MFIEAKKIIGLPVASIEAQEKIGLIDKIVIDPENGKLMGFLITPGGIFGSKKFLSVVDITEWDPNGLVTHSPENLVEPKEVVRAYEVIRKKKFILGMKARTESGKRLGEVEDLLIDTDTESVVKYYLRQLLESRILPADKVIKIEKEIIFADDTTEIPTGAAGVTA